MNNTVPSTPAEFVERMLRDGIHADQLAAEYVNDRDLRDPNINAAVAAYVAANAIHVLEAHNEAAADLLADNLQRVIAAGDLAGPLYRAAKHLGLDADEWIADFKEKLARRQPMPPAGTAATCAALTTLAERWDQLAGPAPDPSEGLLVDEPSSAEYAQAERSATYRTAARDLRDVLRTGVLPHPLMTDAELDQYGTPEENAS
jgi:hypothetical protein